MLYDKLSERMDAVQNELRKLGIHSEGYDNECIIVRGKFKALINIGIYEDEYYLSVNSFDFDAGVLDDENNLYERYVKRVSTVVNYVKKFYN